MPETTAVAADNFTHSDITDQLASYSPDTDCSSAIERIRTFVEWFDGLPVSVIDELHPGSRRDFGMFFGRQLAQIDPINHKLTGRRIAAHEVLATGGASAGEMSAAARIGRPGPIEDIRTFIEWFEALPFGSIDDFDSGYRRELGGFFGRQFSRLRSTREQLKGHRIVTQADLDGGGVRRDVMIYSSWARRFLIRDFYQMQVHYRNERKTRRMRDWIAEFQARASYAVTKYGIDDALLDVSPYSMLQIDVLDERMNALLNGVLQLDKVFANLSRNPADRPEYLHRVTKVSEPLRWIKSGGRTEIAVTRYRIHTPSAHISNDEPDNSSSDEA